LARSALSQKAIGEYETFVFLAGAVSYFWLNGLLKALLPLSAEQGKSRSCLIQLICINFIIWFVEWSFSVSRASAFFQSFAEQQGNA
jgi:hypothetical protein